MKITITLALLIIIGGVGASYIAYQHNLAANDDVRNHILSTTNTIKQLDSMANTLILEARYGLRTDYDELAKLMNGLYASADAFTVGYLAEYAASNAEIEQLLVTFNAQMALKVELVESFKSHNSILRNSIKYAPELGEKLIREATSQGNEEAANQLTIVNSALYRWALNNDHREEKVIRDNAESIIDLYHAILSGVVLVRYSNHVNTVVKEQKTTQAFIDKILAINIQSTIAKLEAEYLDYYVLVINSSEKSLYYVFFYAVMVLAIAVYLAYMLKKSYSALKTRDEYRSQQLNVARKHLDYADKHTNVLKETLIQVKDTLRLVSGMSIETQKDNYDTQKVRSLLVATLKKYRFLERGKILDKADNTLYKSHKSLERVSDLVNDLSVS